MAGPVGATPGRAAGRGGWTGWGWARRGKCFLAEPPEQPAVAQDADDIGIAATDDEVALGLAQIVEQRVQRHNGRSIQVPGVLHAQDKDANILILGLAPHLVLEQVGSAEEQFALRRG